nr:GerMN domain-containing protein [Lachnospiraceae bacterium C1.1]
MNNIWKKINLIVLSLAIGSSITACGKSDKVSLEKKDGDKVQVYFVNSEYDQVLSEEAGLEKEDLDVDKLLKRLEKGPKSEGLKGILGTQTAVLDYSMDESSTLNLNFDKSYKSLGKAEEVLFRMSLVNTFTQLDDVYYLTVSVNGHPLKLNDGTEVGSMSEHTFIENAGKEISSYSKTTLHLYFANSSGTKLIRTDKSLVYSSNIAMEKLVVDNLIAGPDDNSVYATIVPDTKVNSIAVRDGICYCDLDSSIIDQALNVSEEAVFYSLVNSLCEVRGVSKVQISIDGETERVFRDKIDLDRPYSRSTEIVERK